MALTWWDGVTVQVEMAFGEPPTAPTAWTDITADVRDIPFGQVGRRSEFVPFAPASAQLVLDNASRQYDPDYATGPYFGDLVPMVPCRITATVNVTDVDIFYGYVKGWPQQWSRFDATTTVTLIDGSRFQQNETLPASAYAGEVVTDNPWAYYPMNGEAVSEVEDSTAELVDVIGGSNLPATLTGNSVYRDASVPLGGGQTLASGDEYIATNVPYKSVRTQATKTIECYVSMEGDSIRSDSLGSSFSNAYALSQVDDTNGLRLIMEDWRTQVRYSNSTDNERVVETDLASLEWRTGKTFHVVLTVGATDLELYVDGELYDSAPITVGTTTMSGEPDTAVGPVSRFVTDGNRVLQSHVAFYPTGLSSTRIRAHYVAGLHAYGHPVSETTGTRLGRALDDAGWPAALRDIDPGTQPCGPYLPRNLPVLEYARELEATEQGMLFGAENGKLTFLDRQTLWTTDTGVVFTDDEAANDVRLAGLVPDGNTVDTIRNIVTVSFAQVGAITRRDETSITDYGAASESVASSPMPNGEAASNMAAYILRAKKDPTTRYTSMTGTVRGQDGNTTRILDLLQRRIGDVVNVERLPVDTTPQVVKKAMIQGYRFRISRQDWVIDFYLSPAVEAATVVPYLTLGDADDGKIGVTDGNLIPA